MIHLKFQPGFIRPPVTRGFAVASVEWREPPVYKSPSGVEDVKCAIRFLRANAKQLNIDPDHIGVSGCDRGGYMGALVGVTDPGAQMEGQGGFEGVSSRMQAVMMFDGIANFRTNYADAPDELAQIYGIMSFDDPLIDRLSPITYVTSDDPPFLLIASESKKFQNEAQMLTDALTAQGVSATYIRAQGATHCNYAIEILFPYSPE